MASPAATGPAGRGRRAGPLLRTTIGDVLRRIRLAQRRTLADVARTAKVSLPYLSELERGRKEASSEVLAAVCAALRVELADVLAETGRRLAETGRNRRDTRPGQPDQPGRPGQGPVVRLDDIRGRHGPARPTPDEQAPADQITAGQAPASQITADPILTAPPRPGRDEARCLLAA